MIKEILIIGNGIAGTTAARHIRKLNPRASIQMVSSEYPFFFSRTALMYVYMGHMKFDHLKPYEDDFWAKNRITLIYGQVDRIDVGHRKVYLSNGSSLNWTDLIIATGSKPTFFNWPGQHLKGVQGLYSKQDLDLMMSHTQNISSALVVGGGLIGVEMAEMLHSKNIAVKILVKDEWFWGNVLPQREGDMIQRHLERHGISLQFNTRLKSLEGSNGLVEKAITEDGREFPAEFVGIATGVTPNIDFVKNTEIECDRGILVDRNLRTNLPNVYAIGDCAQLRSPLPNRKPIEQVWYTGRMMGETVAEYISNGISEYLPGVWFNSAKFFDLEFQTYGKVTSNPVENIMSYYWEDVPNEKLLHFQYDKKSGVLLGVNALGVRLRHAYFDALISRCGTIQKMMDTLQDAMFDKEFTTPIYRNVASEFKKSDHV
jgi:NADPH-dependent 2,4-dienoyl-CoA reductase/sulfur reductase-like enzyme